MMEFLQATRDRIHHWPHETRTVLALMVMGVVVVAFFFTWIGGISSRLIAIGGPGSPSQSQLALGDRPAGSASSEASSPDAIRGWAAAGARPALSSDAGSSASATADAGTATSAGANASGETSGEAPVAIAPTPAEGVADTFSGLKQFFAQSPDSVSGFGFTSDWNWEAQFRDIIPSLKRLSGRIFTGARDAFFKYGEFLFGKLSRIVAVPIPPGDTAVKNPN